MYDNIKEYSLGNDMADLAKSMLVENIFVKQIQPFCIINIEQLTADDLIVTKEWPEDEISFLKPTSIYFKNGCYVLGHKTIGTKYNVHGHYLHEKPFDGFTCITLHEKLYLDMDGSNKETGSFIFKCKPNIYSSTIDINCENNWIERVKRMEKNDENWMNTINEEIVEITSDYALQLLEDQIKILEEHGVSKSYFRLLTLSQIKFINYECKHPIIYSIMMQYFKQCKHVYHNIKDNKDILINMAEMVIEIIKSLSNIGCISN